jgi:hypothetical protein
LRERVANRRDQRIKLLLAMAEIEGRVLVDVADLLLGQLQEFVRCRLERRCRQRLEGVAELVFMSGAAARGQEPSSRKPATSAPTTKAISNTRQCNSDYRFVSPAPGGACKYFR